MIPLAVYITGILFIICVTIFYGKMNIYLASFLILLYIMYITCLVLKIKKTIKLDITRINYLSFLEAISTVFILIQISTNISEIK